uniref:Uncharacterized protein n=1 Tax=viral metagenome TaxID=1070528 RepID=A0A6C0BA76_9ZZZZ
MSKIVDLLEEDKPIAQQKFVCVSFVSPENIIKSKEQFQFDQFVKTWDMNKSVEKFAKFTAFLAYKYNLDTEQVTSDLTEFCKEESETLNSMSVSDDYKTFLDKNLDALELEYSKQHNFQTNTRGLKIRGVYPSQEEAEVRAKMLRENDPYFDVYVGPVGVWMPWEPDAYRTGKVDFLEKELNELMSNKKANEDNAKEFFNNRVKETKKKAMEENISKATNTGNKLTQTLDKNGDLIGVKNIVDVSEVNAELFESDNIALSVD